MQLNSDAGGAYLGDDGKPVVCVAGRREDLHDFEVSH
jgi:hypothetical protein